MTASYLKMDDVDLANKRVLIREDLNVPIKDGEIMDDTRIRRALPTLKKALSAGAAVLVMSHLGRPSEGAFDKKYSLAPVASALSEALDQPVPLVADWENSVSVAPGEIVLCENVRFLTGEKSNDANLSKKLASLCDVFVMDAFASAHRAHASTTGVAKHAPIACAGPLLNAELTALSKALTEPAKPVLAIVGGAKVSTKIQVLDVLLEKVNTLIVGGGIANTFLAATGISIGKSLVEVDLIPDTKKLLEKAKLLGVEVPLPVDVAVGKQFSADESATTKSVHDISPDDMILDVGPKTAASYQQLMLNAATIVWNGPVGVFEFPAFSAGTKALAQAIAESSAFSVAGGGDTLSAVAQFGISDKISYISTGGGAFLEWMEGKTLPAVDALIKVSG